MLENEIETINFLRSCSWPFERMMILCEFKNLCVVLNFQNKISSHFETFEAKD